MKVTSSAPCTTINNSCFQFAIPSNRHDGCRFCRKVVIHCPKREILGGLNPRTICSLAQLDFFMTIPKSTIVSLFLLVSFLYVALSSGTGTIEVPLIPFRTPQNCPHSANERKRAGLHFDDSVVVVFGFSWCPSGDVVGRWAIRRLLHVRRSPPSYSCNLEMCAEANLARRANPTVQRHFSS